MRLIAGLAAAALLAVVLIGLGDHYGLAALGWASGVQQKVQTEMAGVIRAIKAGDPWALATLCGLSGAYGFLHALGPGHGKVLLGGAALGTTATARRIFALGAAASLAQALGAILLVLVVVNLFRLTSQEASALAEGALATFSRLAIAAIGALLVWRGLRALRAEQHHHHHCGCGHSHGPTAAEVTNLSSRRETFALILSVAARPCTGAIFLLVIAWRFGIPGAGVLGVLAMGLGTAALNALAIGGGLAARRLAWLGRRTGNARRAGVLQVAAGAAVVGLSALTLA
ncbi:nickel/cobalt transporter [Falsirhodobacter sp. 20TX0035]|uniref:nickel/cobalt transporter n=1 Tax=Falsirhodobacter sp. 20TX0035 TaxID=3022019 RepID=UPI00232B6ADA|nr:hypothetical protein [Falsirhodobacter sp. 20TX0035]MDB6454967.1 hypothetical protein [Falsirhodobacter sp. 20TX0035]